MYSDTSSQLRDGHKCLYFGEENVTHVKSKHTDVQSLLSHL